MQHAHALLRAARSPCSTCASVRSLHAHTAPPSHTESIESAQVLSSMVPCWHSGSIQRLPLSLMTVIFPRAFPQSRAAADQYASLLATPACFSLPRDCPILRPRAVGCLSRAEGMRLSVCD